MTSRISCLFVLFIFNNFLVIIFPLTDAENVIWKEQTQPHALNNMELMVSKFYPFMKIPSKEQTAAKSKEPHTSAGNAAAETETDSAQGPPKEHAVQQVHFAVDADIMEFVMTSNHKSKLGHALAQHQSEVNWKPGSSTALITYRGQEADTEAWQGACIEEMQSYLKQFAKCDVQVENDFWQAVLDQMPSIYTSLGKFFLLLKDIADSKQLRIICLNSDLKDFESKLKDHLEEIKVREIKKAYLRKTETDIPEDKIALLKKINFAEKLMQTHDELEIVMDDENGEISFEGPKDQFKEAMMSFRKQLNAMSNRILNLQPKVLEILDDEIDEVAKVLEQNGVEAVFVLSIDDQVAEVVGASSAHAQNAAELVGKLVVEEKVQVEDESLFILKTQKWRELCTVIQDECQVRMRRNQWSDTWILGFAENVKQATAKIETFVDENTVRKEEFKCHKSMRRFLIEQRKDEIKSIQQKLEQFQIKIEACDREEDLVIAGTKEGLARAHKMLALLTTKLNVFKESFQIKQPGLCKFLTKGRGDQLVRSVERDQECVVDVKHNFKKETEESAAAAESSDDEDQESDDDDVDSDDDVTIYGTTAGGVTVAGPSTLVVGSCKISWKTGDITKEQVRRFIVLIRVVYFIVLCFVVPLVFLVTLCHTMI